MYSSSSREISSRRIKKADKYLHLSGGEDHQGGRGVQQGGEVIHQGTKQAGGGGPKQADGEQGGVVDLSEERQNLTEESAL